MTEKWIVGTGFSRGIGCELAFKIKEAGYKILHIGRKKTLLEDEFLWWDLVNPPQDNPTTELIDMLLGKDIAGFIYCAGVMPVLEISLEDQIQKRLFWQSQTEAMRINYFACAELIEEVLPFINRGPNLCPFIAHISSLAAVNPFPGLELYGATKNAALQYFKWLSKRFNRKELSCLSIHPGTVLTDMTTYIIENEPKHNPVAELLTQMKIDNEFILPEQAASKIFDFLFHETELKENAHGKLFLSDKYQIH